MSNATLIKPTRAHARKVLEIVSHGLSSGLGVQEPGKLCVEAAVCMAFGLPHGDNPPCVGVAVRSFKISLNDSQWSSNEARAKGMARIAIAQLGSNEIDQQVFVKELVLATIRKIVPLALRAAAGMNGLPAEHKPKLEACAAKCEGVEDSDAASYASDAASYASDAASDSSAAASAASAASYASAAASDASDAARAASAAASYASYAARAASAAASYASYASAASSKDEVLSMMAEIGVQALINAGSPGCKWLDLVKE